MTSDQPLHFTDDLVISSHVAHNAGVLFFRSDPTSTTPHPPGRSQRQANAELGGQICLANLLSAHRSSALGKQTLDPRSRAWASLVAGSVLGIIGWSGWSGFFWYFVAHAVVRSVSCCGTSSFAGASGPAEQSGVILMRAKVSC